MVIVVGRVLLILKRLLVIDVDLLLLLVLVLLDLIAHDVLCFVLERFLGIVYLVAVLLLEGQWRLYFLSGFLH